MFTATPKSGYQFIGWYSSATTNGTNQDVAAVSTQNPYSTTVTENTTLYALFKEILFDVKVSVDGSASMTTYKVGTVSHPSITASVPSGNVFNRWITTGSAEVGSNFSKTTTLTGASDNQSSVVASFKDEPYIYYYIEAANQWHPSTMYVYFYTSAYWNNSNGSGFKNRTSEHGPMEKMDNNGYLWRYRYNPETVGSITNIAFMQKQQDNYEYFTGNTGSYCAFHSCMNTFVVTSNSGTGKNGSGSNTTYYYNDDWDGNKGYWINYEKDAADKVGLHSGFYLNKLTSNEYSEEFVDTDGDGTFTVTAELGANLTYYFYVGGCDGGNWSNKDDHLAYNNLAATLYHYNDVASNSNRVQITTHAAGFYTFKLTPSMTKREMTLEVVYPVAAGDHRLKHTYNDGSSHTLYSDVIKSGTTSTTVSMYLQMAAGTKSLVLERCSINGSGNPVWYNAQAVSAFNTTTFNKGKGVYKFDIAISGDAVSSVSNADLYTGPYYIRTSCAPGGGLNYKDNPLAKNTLTFSKDDRNTYDYYYCKWVSDAGTDVSCVIANDYNSALSETLTTEAILNNTQNLPYAANVRFSYNSYTNELKRAFLKGSTDWSADFLQLQIKNGNNYTLVDWNNWVYEYELTVAGGTRARLVANYNNQMQYFIGSSGNTLTDANTVEILGSSASSHKLRIVYDFKTNNLLTAWLADGNAIANEQEISTDLMFIRDHQNVAEQVTFSGSGKLKDIKKAYSVMRFNKWTLNNQQRTTGHPTASPLLSTCERNMYYISFPFDVNLSEVFGFGTYGKHWAIQHYDGETRAKNGYWADSPSNWQYYKSTANVVLNKNEGYILGLNLGNLTPASDVWNNNVEDVYLYFPSAGDEVGDLTSTSVEVKVDPHLCIINRPTTDGDRRFKDSHWNCVGVPTYSNPSGTTISGTEAYNTWKVNTDLAHYTEDPDAGYPKFIYVWTDENFHAGTKTLTPKAIENITFITMRAYMMQFAGTITFTASGPAPASIAARHRSGYKGDYLFRLELAQDGKMVDQTYVKLMDDAKVTTDYDFNYDLTKEGAITSNVYTFIRDEKVAGNCLPLEMSQETTVPVGIVAKADGSYTFAMPDGTEGLNVTLYDSQANKYIDLSIEDYTLDLTAGTYDNRFFLTIDPRNSATTIDVVGGEGEDIEAAKIFRNGLLYIQRGDKLYDARGSRIE